MSSRTWCLNGCSWQDEDHVFFAEAAGKTGLKKMVGIPAKVLRMRLKHLSNGMRQKLCVAIALLKNPPTILMGEPTSGLDPKSAQEFLSQQQLLREQDRTIY